MTELTYRTLVWLSYRLAATFSLGVPLVLLIWATIKKEASIRRLLVIYWKISSLMAISMLLLTNERPIGYITSFIAPLLMVISVWFWVDLNEELADLPPWRPLAFTVRIWRWALTGYGVLTGILSGISLNCLAFLNGEKCTAWLEAPQSFHLISRKVFNFLFGANWTEPLASFIGYVVLIAYVVGLLQWWLIRMPKQGRIASDF